MDRSGSGERRGRLFDDLRGLSDRCAVHGQRASAQTAPAEGDDGTTYDPTNLPDAFKQDGLGVEAEARRRDDAAGIHMVGPIVDIVRIRRR